MRIDILGAGPAGLYFAILMKKADPRHEIRVFERNAPDATFGFGVVFSEGSLDELEAADYESYVTITDAFAKWNPLDVRYRGSTTRVRGNVFSGVERKELLRILQARAQSLGVALTFEHEVDSIDAHMEADLVVGADGANSLTRRSHEAWFRPSITYHPTRYAWFGADFALPVFTYIFKETEWGLFQAHCYPYNEHRSTVVVLISAETWRRAGLDVAGEEQSLRLTQAIFQDELGAGRGLLANRSLWASFPWIKCDRWHQGKVVILGDAAHTAHWSIGSGTKLALEDAIALAKAFVKWKDSLESALTEFELERQPVVERFQDASRVSADYFGSVRRYFAMPPVQFAYQLMTRTPRITHQNLAGRDPEFVRGVETWFWAQAGAAAEQRLVAPPPMFAPLKLRAVTLANRLALAPIERWPEASESGAGLIVTPPVAVCAEGRIDPEQPTAADLPPDPTREALAMPSLCHAGRRGAMRPRRGGSDRPLPEPERWPTVSASPQPYAAWTPAPDELDRRGMDAVIAAFAAAAEQVRNKGYRALEIDASRGYLLASFISPLANRRADGYGGSLANRLRFPLEVVAAVRGVWAADLPLALAYSASDLVPRGGLPPDESLEVARAFKHAGVDLIRVLAGQTIAESRPDYGRMYGAAYSDRVRNECGIPTVACGQITNTDEINTLVAAGRADVCILERL